MGCMNNKLEELAWYAGPKQDMVTGEQQATVLMFSHRHLIE
jgi:hypothetical protein